MEPFFHPDSVEVFSRDLPELGLLVGSQLVFDPDQLISEKYRLESRLVQETVHRLNRAEYKRQQAPPGLKVTTKAFGIGRRYPIAQRFLE